MHRRALLNTCVAGLLAYAPAFAAAEDTHAHGPHTLAAKTHSRDASFGREGDARKVQRVIRIDMSDTMRYFPDQIRVRRGESVRFVVRNRGKIPHEMVLGSMDDLKKHAMLMKENGAVDHEGPAVVHVGAGGSGRLIWQFTQPGEFYYGCLIPGHFEAGMIGTIVVR